MMIKSMAFSILESLMLLPVVIWIYTLLPTDQFLAESLLITFGSYVLGVFLGWFIQKWFLRILFTLIVMFGLSIYMFDSFGIESMIIGIVMFSFIIRATVYANENARYTLPVMLIWAIGLPSYFLSYFFYMDSAYQSVQNVLNVSAIVLVFFLLFLTNADHLKQATLAKEQSQTVDQSIKRHNKFYIILTFIVVLLITRFNFVSAIIVGALRGVFNLLSLISPTGDDEGVGEMPAQPELELGEAQEPSMFASFIDSLLRIVVGIAIVLFVLFLVYLFIKKAPRLSRRLFNFVNYWIKRLLRIKDGESFQETEGYRDEIESVFNLEESIKSTKEKLKKRFSRQVKWHDLSNRQKVRRLFIEYKGKAGKQGQTYHNHETANEYLLRTKGLVLTGDFTSELLRLYNQARYSSHDVESVEAIYNQLKQLD
ncbi:hypothetical protein SAMN05421734_1027 [Pelagirhabdus alkalitolerans]|uniref:DUF4129 domain-containing protein n=1 Tax=Pelagirhabdus alkalitolerans TaxID=1612202 RepID=A0A1G6GX89_9BACI|nr:hypothetical protein [Pelagirhabdus alkalitolerans]SDB86680.1 hypothetical protein SAMN05421734_1027 [Pelagirhabdus alkalitolerans]